MNEQPQEISITMQVLERAGGQLVYWLTGRENQPLVVFTHGSSVDHHLFDPQLDVIGEDYRVLVWDIRGHGHSKPIDQRFSLALAADDLTALIHEVGYQRAILVGQSMGSYVCQEAIFRHPEIAAGFVSIGAGCITLSQTAFDWLRLKVGTALSAIYPYEAFKKPTARLASSTPQGQAYLLEAMSQISTSEYVHIMRGVGRGFHPEKHYQIRCPLLLTRGDKDYAGLQKQLAQWAQRDQAAVVDIPDAGHIANYDNPAFFNQVLLSFLNQHLGSHAAVNEPLYRKNL